MNISSITQANNINITKTNKSEKSKKVNNNGVNKELMTNSISETIGRSQVSFSGRTRNNDERLEHSSILGRKIMYEKNDGSLVFRTNSFFGKLKREEQYFPQQQGKIVREVKKGIETLTATAPGYKLITKTDKYGNELYHDEKFPNGDRDVSSLELDRGRRVNRQYRNGLVSIQVIDLKTKKPVLSGPLVVDEFKHENGKVYTLQNIVTGQILKEERYEYPDKENLIYSKVYSELTGKITELTEYIPNKDVYQTQYWDDYGKPLSFIITSSDESKDRVFKYGDDGRTIVSQTDKIYDEFDALLEETEYIPKTEIRTKSIKYKNGSTKNYSVHYYRGRTNRLDFIEIYSNNERKKEISYHDDGVTKKHITEFLADDARKETDFNTSEVKIKEVTYNNRDEAILTRIYDGTTEVKVKEITFDDYTGNSTETDFNKNTGKRTRQTVKNYTGDIESETTYYGDGQQRKTERRYHFDGSSTYTTFTEDGEIKSRVELNPDGTIKTPVPPKQKRTYTDEEIILQALDKAASGNISGITNAEFIALARILEVEDVSKLTDMKQDTYRKLAFKFHPDRVPEEKKASSEKIFQLVNLLYKKG